MRVHIFISLLLSLAFLYNADLSEPIESVNDSDCLMDELDGDFTNEEFNNLVDRRELVREKMKNSLFRNETDTLFIPVVFHNYYQMNDGVPFRSFCDYVIGNSESTWEYNENNDSLICYQRAEEALEIINEQFASSVIKFIPSSETSLVIDNKQSDYKWIINDNWDAIKVNNHISNLLNIYITPCIGINDSVCGSIEGFSTYPEKITSNQGIAIAHSYFPGINDNSIGTLAHEIGHVFTLRHLYHLPVRKNADGLFEVVSDFQRELVSNDECNSRGDLICDTPGQPLNDVGDAFNIGNCIYHGFGGEYDAASDSLKIGGSSQTGDYRDDFELYTNEISNSNQDEIGEFWGTLLLPEDCYLDNKEEYSTGCPVSLYEYDNLPIAENFLQLSGIRNNCIYSGDIGYTPEQFANIRYSIEFDYTACNIEDACNTDSSALSTISPDNLFRFGESSCKFPCAINGGCLVLNSEELWDYTQYDCSGNLLASNINITPEYYEIHHIYPNPFNSTTTIHYSLSQNIDVQISIYNITGRLIATLINEFQVLGYHSITWDATAYASGIYILNMSSEKFTETQKFLLIK